MRFHMSSYNRITPRWNCLNHPEPAGGSGHSSGEAEITDNWKEELRERTQPFLTRPVLTRAAHPPSPAVFRRASPRRATCGTAPPPRSSFFAGRAWGQRHPNHPSARAAPTWEPAGTAREPRPARPTSPHAGAGRHERPGPPDRPTPGPSPPPTRRSTPHRQTARARPGSSPPPGNPWRWEAAGRHAGLQAPGRAGPPPTAPAEGPKASRAGERGRATKAGGTRLRPPPASQAPARRLAASAWRQSLPSGLAQPRAPRGLWGGGNGGGGEGPESRGYNPAPAGAGGTPRSSDKRYEGKSGSHCLAPGELTETTDK